MKEIVKIRGLTRAFGDITVLNNISLDIANGEFVALLGRSGSGKSTFLRVLAGLDEVPASQLELPQRKSVVFQEPRLLPWKTVFKNVTLGATETKANGMALKMLEDVGLSHRVDAWPLTLSGGEAQRAAMARALVRQPQLLLLDEPFAALDALTRMRMHDLVFKLCRKHGPATLLVTHDVWEAIALADRILVLDEGRFIYDCRVEISHPRQRTSQRAATLESQLLAALGVKLNMVEPDQQAKVI